MRCLFWLGLIFITLTRAALQSPGHVVMFAILGDSVTLPCAISSGNLCSSITWTMAEEFGSRTEVVRVGRETAPNVTLLSDCSLQIGYMVINDAKIYTCDNGKLNSSVDLQILQITENPDVSKNKIELHCYLNIYKGLANCDKSGTQIRWFTEDNTLVSGERFHFENPSNCFSKLIIKSKKLTDHHRKWKCQVTKDNSVKATATFTTTLTEGIEEMFAAVGESVSFTCKNTSFFPAKGQTPRFITDTGSSAIINKVSPLYSGDYQCLDSVSGKHKRIRLHTVDIALQFDSEGNVTLSCVLTCANSTCDKDFNVTWSENNLHTPTGLLNVNGSLINKLYIPNVALGPGESVCTVRREGAVVATKKWRYCNSLHSPAWVALPLGLMCLAAAAGAFCLYLKRKHNKDAENLQAHIGMTHIYEDVQDCGHQPKREVKDSFYDLLQAVN